VSVESGFGGHLCLSKFSRDFKLPSICRHNLNFEKLFLPSLLYTSLVVSDDVPIRVEVTPRRYGHSMDFLVG
jgi:hypothetical protein